MAGSRPNLTEGESNVPELTDDFLRQQLLNRREKLASALTRSQHAGGLAQLLNEVDAALERMEAGTYGLCESCHDSIEKGRLIADPLTRYCLDHLTSPQQRALEQDLELASRIQRDLLPKRDSSLAGWQVSYHYAPLGPVSGDYCDVITPERDSNRVFLALGDASGKGVAASLLMAHLHAIFRTLIPARLPLHELVERAGRIFCESTATPDYFATLVCAMASAAGEIEVCNAGHCPPLLLRAGNVTKLEEAGMPLGMFCNAQYSARPLKLAPGDVLFFYTDGLTEARSFSHQEYGDARLMDVLARHDALSLPALIQACLEDLAAFRAGAPLTDDLSIMAIRRAA